MVDQLIPVGACVRISGVTYGVSGPTGRGTVTPPPVWNNSAVLVVLPSRRERQGKGTDLMKMIHRVIKAAEHVALEALPVPHPVVFALHTAVMMASAVAYHNFAVM
jgi:hypothetical protein